MGGLHKSVYFIVTYSQNIDIDNLYRNGDIEASLMHFIRKAALLVGCSADLVNDGFCRKI